MRLANARKIAIGIVAAAALLSPQIVLAASTFYGEAIHVSTTNIKVRNPRDGQILSFEILPHFYKIFSPDGKTTYQMKDIHNGQYVAIIYDQAALGMRHADEIYIMNNANQRLQKP